MPLASYHVLTLKPKYLLKDITYESDPFVSQLIRETIMKLNWDNSTDRLMISHSQQMLLLHIVRQYSQQSLRQPLSSGGLSPINQRRVVDFIEANLSHPFSLRDLAALVQLSDFHFARMFKVSFACTPHQYVLSRRVELAKQLLASHTSPLIDIAIRCGFSSQQHLSQQFKQRVGVTPGTFRRAQGKNANL